MWAALLDGQARAAACEAARVAIGFVHPPSTDVERIPGEQHGLPAGAAGDALALAYLTRCLGGDDEPAAARLTAAAEALATDPMDPGLHAGFAGIAWVVDHLCPDDPDDPVAPIDEVVLTAARGTWPIELMSGVVGFAVYALDRLPRPLANQILDAVVERIAREAEAIGDGLAWPLPTEMVPADARALASGTHFLLGTAHGAAGTITALARIVRATGDARARALAEAGVRWLRQQRRRVRDDWQFTTWVTRTQSTELGHFAWCHGDPGIAAALLVAGRALEDERLVGEAVDVARIAAQRSPRIQPNGHSLCHGTAGLGHMFNRMWQATGDPALREAARGWFARTIAAWRPSERGFLQGDAGVGLALLAAATEVEPGWDRVLLLS